MDRPLWLLLSLAACSPDSLSCGAGTVERDGVCAATDDGGVVTVTQTVTHTEVVTEQVPDEDLDPGRFEPVLARLAAVYGGDGAVGTNGALEEHMHVDEVRYRADDQRLFYCSYTFGVIDVSNPTDPEYEAQGYEWDLGSPVDRPTGCLHLDWDDADPEVLYVSHRGNYDFQPHLSVVHLGTYTPDPLEPTETALAPVLAEPLREDGASYEGLDAEGGYVYVALHAGGIGVFERDPATNTLSRVATSTLVPNAYDVEVVGGLAYALDDTEGLFILDVSDLNDITLMGQLSVGGSARDIRVSGDIAWLAAGSAGLVAVDVSDPTAPSLTSYTPTPGTAVRLGQDGDRVAVAAWNDTRVYDVSDPSAPAMLGAVRLERDKVYAEDPDRERPNITARTLGVDLAGDHLYVGNWMIPYTYAIHSDRVAPYLVVPEAAAYLGMGTIAPGEEGEITLLLGNEGTADLTITDLWTNHPDFTVEPPQARIAPGAQASFTIRYSASHADQASTIVHIQSDDPTQPQRAAYVVANAVGIGVGDPFPETLGTLVHGLEPWSSSSLAGDVAIVAYFATFCPVCSLEMPDLQRQFAETYAAEGLQVVGIDADADDRANPDAVAAFVDNLGVTLPILVEDSDLTPTYTTIEGIYDGGNPFPVDIVIDRQGIIRHVSREYDPPALHAIVQELLAESP
jgi:peroxiredoxin